MIQESLGMKYDTTQNYILATYHIDWEVSWGKKNYSWNNFHSFLKPKYTHEHPPLPPADPSRATTEKASFLPLWKGHCSHTSVWSLPCSDQRSPPCLRSCRRAAEGRGPHTARGRPRNFQTRGCASRHFLRMRGHQTACWRHRKKSTIDSGSLLDAQLSRRLPGTKFLLRKKKRWIGYKWEGSDCGKDPDQSQILTNLLSL